MSGSRWEPTAAHVRALVVALVVGLGAALARRPDLLVLASPFVIAAAWGLAGRPDGLPQARHQVSPAIVPEGGIVHWEAHITVPRGARDLAAVQAPTAYFASLVGAGAVAVAVPDTHLPDTPVALQDNWIAERWGHFDTGSAIVTVTSALGAFRWSPGQLPDTRVVVLPGKDAFTSRTGMPHPTGIVGLNRGARSGDGTDFAAVRAYGPGDRLSRIDWARSSRAGALQVAATHADLDTQILLIVDAFHDIGVTGGTAGVRSSLDTAVRAATALAEHYLRTGERVGLIVLGSRDLPTVPATAGRAQVRRIRDVLAAIRPGSVGVGDDRAVANALSRVPAGALVLVLTPGISAATLGRTHSLSRSGHSVLIIDTMPPAAAEPLRLNATELDALAPMRSPREAGVTRTAWRLRLLERATQLHRLVESGVPVVPWAGPGSLDEVLRQLRRRARAPRLVRR